MKEKIFLFLDDDAFKNQNYFINEGQRDPKYYYPLINAPEMLKKMEEYTVVKFTTAEGAMDYIEKNGCPNFISFDNDLKRDLEGTHLAKWLIEKDLDNEGFIPNDFDFLVHSQNIIAKENIYGLLNQYLDIIKKERNLDSENEIRKLKI